MRSRYRPSGLTVRRVPAVVVRKMGQGDLHAEADAREFDVSRPFRGLRAALTDDALASMVRDPATIERLVNELYEEQVRPPLERALGDTAGAVAGREVVSLGVDLSFEVLNPKAAAWAATQSATLVKEITADQVEALRRIVTRGYLAGEHPSVVAREVRDAVGLHSRYVRAVANYRRALEARGVRADRVERQAARYARKLLNLRARTIARTELMQAANVGQRLAWEEAASQGLLRTETLVREWLASNDDRIDGTCLDLSGMIVAFAAEFPLGDPPVHPACRCSVGLREATTEELRRFGS